MIQINKEQIKQLQKINQQQLFNDKLINCIKSEALLQLIKNVYSYATLHDYTCEQKLKIINKLLQLMPKIAQYRVQKINFIQLLEHQICGLSQRNKQVTIYFKCHQTNQLLQYLKTQILPYYELYEAVLDQSPSFQFKAQVFDPIEKFSENPIFKGKVVQVQSINILKQYVGEKVQKQIKQQPKKK